MKYALICLCLMGVALGGEPKDRAVVSFVKHKNSIVVKAYVNGKGPFRFVLDTGASLTVISPEIAGKLGVTRTGEKVMIMGVGPGSSLGHMCRLKELSLGDARARNFSAVIHGIPHLNQEGVIGLLGQDFLERFNLQFNNHKKLLTLTLPNYRQGPAPPKLTPLEKGVRNVLANPAAPYEDFNKATQRLAELYDNRETKTFEADLKAARTALTQAADQVETLYQHLLNGPAPGGEAAQRNNVQKFLYCHTGFKANLRAARTLASALSGSNEEVWGKAWREMELADQRFEGCRR